MRLQSSVAAVTPLALAGVAVSAEKNTIGGVDHNDISVATTQDYVNTPSTTNNDSAPMKRRFLQKIKRRNQIFGNGVSSSSNNKQNGMPDVGILSRSRSSDTPRFLQGDDDGVTFFCPRTTCPSALCDCAEDGGSLEQCSTELQSVCLNGKLADCVFSDYVQVYQSVYCPFTFCLNDGFQENQCDCAFYDLYCAQIQEDKAKCDELLNADAGTDEKMPFFGCDETTLVEICDQSKSCREQGDLNGLPLGEWKGMAYRMNDAGGRSSSGVIWGTLGLLSAFMFLMNN